MRTKQGYAIALVKQVARTASRELPDDCMLWPFAIDKGDGYGKVNYSGTIMTAHRAVMLERDNLADTDLVARHRCKNRHCINSNHLEWGTHSDNERDKVRDGTVSQGESNHKAKLTESQVIEIYDRCTILGESKKALSLEFGVSDSNISLIITGKSWKHLNLQERSS